MSRFAFFNDTGRNVSIHPATYAHGCVTDSILPIKPSEIREFVLPEGTYPVVKMWDYDNNGLSIFVMPEELKD